MSLGKLSLYAMLATVLAFASAGELNRYIKNSGVPQTGVPQTKAWPSALTLTTDFPVEGQAPPAGFLPVQSKNAQSLRAGTWAIRISPKR
jgi:hypothetical protein